MTTSSKWVSLPFFAKRVGASKQRCRHHARLNLFGAAARRTAEGWQLDLEPALKAWRTGRDLNTAPMQVVLDESARIRQANAAPEANLVMAWDGPGGHYEATPELARRAAEAFENDRPLDRELVTHLDNVLRVMSLLPADFECGSMAEAAS